MDRVSTTIGTRPIAEQARATRGEGRVRDVLIHWEISPAAIQAFNRLSEPSAMRNA